MNSILLSLEEDGMEVDVNVGNGDQRTVSGYGQDILQRNAY